jgi:hypothetical protein
MFSSCVEVALVMLFLAKLVSPHLDLPTLSYGVSRIALYLEKEK